MLFLWAIVGAAVAGQAWFYPGRGDEVVTIGPDSTIAGLPVQRSGALLARVADPTAIAALPDVQRVVPLGGQAWVVWILPREGVDELSLSRRLRGRDDVAWAHPDLILPTRPHGLPDDPYVTDQWHLMNTGQSGWTPGVDLDAETAWALSTGSGALVAIIDTGVDLTHPDLSVISGWDYIDSDDDSTPDPSYSGGPHGTGVAGLAAAVGGNGVGVAGVAYDADIYAIRFVGGEVSFADLYDAFVEAVDAGAWVLSNSWGYGDDCPSFPTYGAIEDALEYAETQGRGGLGTAVVFSAGNSGCDVSGDGLQKYSTVISVAAINGNDERESYSSYGDPVDISAPSGGLVTTDLVGSAGYGEWGSDPDYYGYFSGTSASAPLVSGVLALMFSANLRLEVDQARQILCETAVRIEIGEAGYDEQGWSPYFGCGRIDAGAAVLAVANEAPLAPVVTAPLGEALADEVVLRWEPAVDGDDDPLTYDVIWWLGWDRPFAQEVELDGNSLDITAELSPGDEVFWQVTARDLWGAGEPGELQRFQVVSTSHGSSKEQGCASNSGGPSAAWFSLLPLLWGRRRRLV